MRIVISMPTILVVLVFGFFIAALLFGDGGITGFFTYEPLIDPASVGLFTENRSGDYRELVDALFASGNVTQTLEDGSLWVPWYSSSSSCRETDLKAGASCDIGDVTMTRNCMVTDEFSQVGIIAAMGADQARMDGFASMIERIPSDYGTLPSWRVYRDGETVYACAEGVNANCDSASDADARVIIALLTAAENPSFSSDAREAYEAQGMQMAQDFVEHNLVDRCYRAQGTEVCHWLAGGPNVADAGMEANAFAYTGYFADASIAMLAACSASQNETYCGLANNISLSYLQAAAFDGSTFTAPPGLNFRWDLSGDEPRAVCTNTCDPVTWDSADAPRALGMCQALYYATEMNRTLTGLEPYCRAVYDRHLSDPTSAPYQFAPDGSATAAPVSSYFSQGLQSFVYAGLGIEYETVLDRALDHYATPTRTFDWQSCMGVYHPAIVIRSLGMGVGLDSAAFDPIAVEPVIAEPLRYVRRALEGDTLAFSMNESSSWFLDEAFVQDATNVSLRFDEVGEFAVHAERMGVVLAIWDVTVEGISWAEMSIVEGSTIELSTNETSSWFLNDAFVKDAQTFVYRFNDTGVYALRADRMGNTIASWNITVGSVSLAEGFVSEYHVDRGARVVLTYALDEEADHTARWTHENVTIPNATYAFSPIRDTEVGLEIDLGHRTIDRMISISLREPAEGVRSPGSSGRSSSGATSGSSRAPNDPVPEPAAQRTEPEPVAEPDTELIITKLIESYENRTVAPVELIGQVRALLRGSP